MTNTEGQAKLLAARQHINKMFGGRRARRATLRRYLKAHGVPKPIFPKVSQMLAFKSLNAATFIEDVMKEIKRRRESKVVAEPKAEA